MNRLPLIILLFMAGIIFNCLRRRAQGVRT